MGYPGKYAISGQCWPKIEPTPVTLAQYWNNDDPRLVFRGNLFYTALCDSRSKTGQKTTHTFQSMHPAGYLLAGSEKSIKTYFWKRVV